MKFMFQTDERLYFIMELCQGGDLAQFMRYRKFQEEDVRYVIAMVTLALQNLHERDIIHRDIKPENILVNLDGYIYLADFGISIEHLK